MKYQASSFVQWQRFVIKRANRVSECSTTHFRRDKHGNFKGRNPDAIAEMSVMDVVALVEAMEEKFGVSAAAAVAVQRQQRVAMQVAQQQLSRLNSTSSSLLQVTRK